ncbi:MAG: stage II sporulation protein M [Haloechinothrix sp.]
MDVDVFMAAHRAEWERLQELVRRREVLRGLEADELVTLYQRAATHLSIVRSAAPDPALLSRLSSLVASARAAVTGSPRPSWREFGSFFTRRFPAAMYRSSPWWVPTGVLFLLVSGVLGAWVASDPLVQATIAAPEDIRALTAPGGEFESYYSSEPAASFAAQVWTNNAWVAAGALVLGVLFGVPVVLILAVNAANVGVAAGLMAAAGRLDVFFGLITPHGLLELTAVFVAAGAGLRLGWTVVDPGGRTRADALAQEGRVVAGMALGLTCVLVISGVIEAFVTPSGLPTLARIGIGAAAEVAFLGYVFVLGRRAALAGETGDIDARHAGDSLPAAG